MRYVRVTVRRDINTVYSRDIAPWELPMLEYLFEPGNVQREDDSEWVEAPDVVYPEANQEFDRLMRVYGTDETSGVPHVASVYGNSRLGVQALGREIVAAKAAEEAAKPKAKKFRRPAARVFELDPLLA